MFPFDPPGAPPPGVLKRSLTGGQRGGRFRCPGQGQWQRRGTRRWPFRIVVRTLTLIQSILPLEYVGRIQSKVYVYKANISGSILNYGCCALLQSRWSENYFELRLKFEHNSKKFQMQTFSRSVIDSHSGFRKCHWLLGLGLYPQFLHKISCFSFSFFQNFPRIHLFFTP